MKIYIATDHSGFELKDKLVPFLNELGHEVVDKGAFAFAVKLASFIKI
jgi:ribose 5-phosphate isomerase B